MSTASRWYERLSHEAPRQAATAAPMRDDAVSDPSGFRPRPILP